MVTRSSESQAQLNAAGHKLVSRDSSGGPIDPGRTSEAHKEDGATPKRSRGTQATGTAINECREPCPGGSQEKETEEQANEEEGRDSEEGLEESRGEEIKREQEEEGEAEEGTEDESAIGVEDEDESDEQGQKEGKHRLSSVSLSASAPASGLEHLEGWKPRTELGRRIVRGDKITIQEIFLSGETIREIQIIDALVPDLQSEIIPLSRLGPKRVARRDRSGRKYTFKWGVVVGNRDGLVGFGIGKGRESYAAIQKGLTDAKGNLVMARRGCGSWECRCGGTHSIPFKTSGKAGSVRVDLKPAPRGVGLIVADRTKPIFELAGIGDIYSQTIGDTRTTENLAKAAFQALRNLWSIAGGNP